MKFLFYNDSPCGPLFVRMGIAKVLQACGHQCLFYNEQQRSTFDVFTEYQPDVFFGQTYNLTRPILKNITKRPDLKVILYCSAWGELIESIDRKTYPIVIVNEQEKRNVELIKNNVSFVWLHLSERYLKKVIGGWESLGIKTVGLLNAADCFDYIGGKHKEELASDISIVSGFWNYKAQNLNKYIIPLCNKNTRPKGLENIKIKLFGNQAWPTSNYLGAVDTSIVRDIFASATICPNISEPHSNVYGYDIVERPFKVLLNGFCISDYVESMEKDVFTNNEIPFFHTVDEFNDMLHWFIKNPDDRLSYMKRGRETVLRSHTYFHRCEQIFMELGMHNEATSINKRYKELHNV